jgi:hypothetical protein
LRVSFAVLFERSLSTLFKEELDRREQIIQTLTAENEDLSSTISTLNAELIGSNDEAERISCELDALRSRTQEDNAYESSVRERDAAELERMRQERDEWERAAQEEGVTNEQLKAQVETLVRELQVEAAEREAQAREVIREKKTSANLQSVLEDFQAGASHLVVREHSISSPPPSIRERTRNTTSRQRTRESIAKYHKPSRGIQTPCLHGRGARFSTRLL